MMTPRTDFSKETDGFIEGYYVDSTTLAISFIKKWVKSDFGTNSFSLSDIYSIGRNIYLLDLEQVIRFKLINWKVKMVANSTHGM